MTTIESLSTPSSEERMIEAYGLTAMDIDAHKQEMDKTGPWWLDEEEVEEDVAPPGGWAAARALWSAERSNEKSAADARLFM